MNPNEALQLYLCLKLHFTTPSYDAIKYNFTLAYKPDFTKRRDKYQMNKLARHKDPKGLLLANMCVNPSLWVGKLFEPEAQERYWAWKKYQESQSYMFQEELKLFGPDSFQPKTNEHPEALRLYMSHKVSLDTLTILNDFICFTKQWKLDDPIWNQVKFRIEKYRAFVEYDADKVKLLIKEMLL